MFNVKQDVLLILHQIIYGHDYDDIQKGFINIFTVITSGP